MVPVRGAATAIARAAVRWAQGSRMAQLTGLESMMAARYLRRLSKGSYRVYWLPVAFALGPLAVRGVLYYLSHSRRYAFSTPRIAIETGLHITANVTLVLMVLFAFFVWLIRRYTIFSSISIFG